MSSVRTNPCATCGICCHSYVVPVTGYDVWLISTNQRLAPEDFLIAFPLPSPEVDGFKLESDKPTYGLALDKAGPFRKDGPCVFLMRLGDKHERCGIYNDRPSVCRAYPMAMWGATLFQREDVLCPDGSWPPEEPRRPQWRDALQRFMMHHDIYCEVVARWNARFATLPDGARLTLRDYFTFLMNVYDRLARLNNELGEDQVAAIQASWPSMPRQGVQADSVQIRPGELPWLDYLLATRGVIDSFFPEVEPQPMVALLPARWPKAAGSPQGVAPPLT
ncbi:MAG: YkgJ family cysteine cluster protein [Chloroflexi bacterium]|nr:YkgJ family cysteine cluster protein [Chloroflexota bacterium]